MTHCRLALMYTYIKIALHAILYVYINGYVMRSVNKCIAH